MSRIQKQRPPAPFEYAASVIPGLEDVAGDEIKMRLKNAQLLDQRRGWVVFCFDGNAADLLRLRTTEDIFVVLFRTAELPALRKKALPLLANMAEKSRYWEQALTAFHQTHKPVRRVTFRVIAQMTGEKGFRRQEVRDAVLAGVLARWGNWKPIADDAHLEVWAPTIKEWALIAIRLSTRQMRHRTYKEEHLPASLRPTLAAAMVRLAHPKPSDCFCDPMCGAGTILAERALIEPYRTLLGGDISLDAVNAAAVNLSRVADCSVALWDARVLPLCTASLDVVVCNLPFGEKIGLHVDNPALYDRFFRQVLRVLRPGGRAVLLTSEKELMRQLFDRYPRLAREREVLVGVLGQAARIYVLRKK